MINIILCISLTILGTFCATCSISFYIREKNNFKFRLIMLAMGLFSFIYCVSYAALGYCRDFSVAYIVRDIGLAGLISFLITESVFLIVHLISSSKVRHFYEFVVIAFGLVNYSLYTSPSVIEFVEKNGRVCFYAVPSPFRTIHNMYIGYLFVSMFIMAMVWLKKAHLKREKIIVQTMIAANFFMLFSSIADTFLPLFGFESFPGTCYGTGAVCISMWFISTKMNAFAISVQNLGTYIFKDNNTNILLFNPSGELVLCNNHAEEFLTINNMDGCHLQSIFEITKPDADDIFTNILHSLDEEEYRLKPRRRDEVCSVIFTPVYDMFHDPYCITCFVYDLSKEVAVLKKVDEMRQLLQEDVKHKSYELDKFTLQAITTIVNTIDAKDTYTKGHSMRVSEYSAILAKAIGWDEESVQNIKYIALLHDIGKIGIPDYILCKPSGLTDEEFTLIKSHTQIGSEILKDITMLPHISDGAEYHHEHYDGNGYPCGLKGDEIPLIARIICIADSYDAMNSRRIYRGILDQNSIVDELKKYKGTQFDPDLTDTFIELLENGKMVLPTEKSSDGNTVLLNKIIKNREQEDLRYDDYDPLTNVLNDDAGKKLTREEMQITSGCFMLVHVNNLKVVNNKFGPARGDKVLQIIAGILKSQCPNGVVYRVYGNVFACFFSGTDKEEAEQTATSILHTFRSKKSEEKSFSDISLSMGLSNAVIHDSYETVYQAADKALYHIRKEVGEGYSIYERDINEL